MYLLLTTYKLTYLYINVYKSVNKGMCLCISLYAYLIWGRANQIFSIFQFFLKQWLKNLKGVSNFDKSALTFSTTCCRDRHCQLYTLNTSYWISSVQWEHSLWPKHLTAPGAEELWIESCTIIQLHLERWPQQVHFIPVCDGTIWFLCSVWIEK